MGEIVSGVWDTVTGAVKGVVDAVEQIPVVGDVVKGGMDLMHSLGPVGSLAASFAVPGIGSMLGLADATAGAVVYDASGMAIDAAAVADGSVELAGGVAYDAAGKAIAGSAVDAAAAAVKAGANASTMSSVLSGAKTLGTMAQVGGNLYQAYQGLTKSGQTPQQAQNSADPYASFRAGNAAELNALVADPSSLTKSRGYTSGLDAALTGTQRQLAQTGQSMSGMGNYNMALTAGDYFNTQFQNRYNQLATLAGANQAPSVGQTANIAQQKLNATTQASSLNYLNQGVAGIQDLLKSYWG